MKKLVALFCVLGLMLGLSSTSASAADKDKKDEKILIKIAGMKPDGEPETIGMRNFGKYLEELSQGKFKVDVFPNNSLGKEDAYIASTKKGIIQMCATGTQMSMFLPSMAMFETPMLYDDLDHARRAMEGDTLKLITKGFIEKSGIRLLNAFPLGFRHFYTKKPINSMDDLKNLRMRVPNIPLYHAFAKACGISGQAMPFAEVPAALDQGTIDGGDSPFADIISLKMYEITPNITLSGHILVIHSLFMNEKFYQSLTDQEKQWVEEAAKRSADDVWKIVAEGEKNAVKIITDGGGKVATPSAAFHDQLVKAGQESWKLFYNTVPNAKEILDSAAKYRKAN